MAAVKKPVSASRSPSRESKLRTVAKATGLTLEKAEGGYVLADADTGTLVAADWADNSGLPLDAIEAALKRS